MKISRLALPAVKARCSNCRCRRDRTAFLDLFLELALFEDIFRPQCVTNNSSQKMVFTFQEKDITYYLTLVESKKN